MTVRKLQGPDDYNECIQIMKSKKKVGGTEPTDLETIIDSHDKYFIENILSDRYQAYGYIENNTIVSFILQALLENKSRGRFWVIPGIFTSKPYNLFSFNKPEIGSLIKVAFETAEHKEYYEYYYTIAKHVSEVYERQINKTTYIPLYRYDRIDLGIVPANTIPTVDMYWKLLGAQTRPHDMMIKKRVLRKEFRINT
jgi:hypothetical protein